MNQPRFRTHAVAISLIFFLLLGAALLVFLLLTGGGWGASMGENWVAASHWTDVPPANIAKADCSYPACELTDLFDVIAAGPGLVAVGANDAGDITSDGDYLEADSGGVWTSEDGLAWKAVGGTGSGFVDGNIMSVAKSDEGLVAVGSNGSGAAAWISDNGLEWTPVGGKIAGSESEIEDVAAAGPGLVAVGADGDNGAVWISSTGGRSWKQVAAFEHAVLNAITVGGPGLVAVGCTKTPGSNEGAAAVWLSRDGLTWTRAHDPVADFDRANLRTVAAFRSGLVAAGESDDGSAVWTSKDGRRWSKQADDSTFIGATISDVIAGGPGLVAVGEVESEETTHIPSAAVWTSADGRSWRLRSIREGYGGLRAATTFGGKLVAVGYEQPGYEDSSIAAAWVSEK